MLPDNLIRPEQNFMHKFFRVRDCELKQKQWCQTHMRFCNLEVHPDLEVAGMPCQPNSRIGHGLKQEDPRFTCYISWAKHHIRQKTKVIVLENVVEPGLLCSRFG